MFFQPRASSVPLQAMGRHRKKEKNRKKIEGKSKLNPNVMMKYHKRTNCCMLIPREGERASRLYWDLLLSLLWLFFCEHKRQEICLKSVPNSSDLA